MAHPDCTKGRSGRRSRPRRVPGRVSGVAEDFDVQAMIDRFRDRARVVRNRGVPPVEGPERRRFIEQAKLDYMDYAMLGDAEGTLEDGVLVLRIDLRPKDA